MASKCENAHALIDEYEYEYEYFPNDERISALRADFSRLKFKSSHDIPIRQ